MNPTPEEYAAVIQDIALILENEPDEFLDRFEGEPEPREIDFIYTPPADQQAPATPPAAAREPAAESPAGIPEKPPSMAELSEKFSLKRASTLKTPERPRTPDPVPAQIPSDAARPAQPVAAQPPVRGPLEPNMACTLCSDRIYPVRRWRVPGKNPVLVLHYNGPVREGDNRVDRSTKHVLGSAEEDDLFARMLQAAGWEMDDIHFQEYPGCHFNAARSMPDDWNERCRNCLSHVQENIRHNNIRLLVLTGSAAVFLLSEEKAKQMAESGEALPLEFEGASIPALVIRSPAALLALEKKRMALKSAGGNKEQYESLVTKEKKIKQAILGSLKTARTKFLA